MTDIWNDNDYTDDQVEALVKANRDYRTGGEPQKAQILAMQVEQKLPFDQIKLPGDVSDARARRLALRPETTVDPGLLDVPPRHGKGSGQAVWQEFASLVSTMDDEVIDQFTRDEIIQILIDRDIIDGDKTAVEDDLDRVIAAKDIVHVDEPELDFTESTEGTDNEDDGEGESN